MTFKVTVYIDPDDDMIDPVAAGAHFHEHLERMGLQNTTEVRTHPRLRGRAPLLVIDGGGLADARLAVR